jgi:Tfp pilus assembly protein PilN
MAEKLKKSRWRYTNVLKVGGDSRQLWRFAANGDVTLTRTETGRLDQPLSKEAVKDWRSLFKAQLNVAWLPAEHVYLRALQLPTNDPAEVAPMVELQLEKLSPLPVGQIVWTVEFMPGASFENLQTVVVIIVARDIVEEFLGRLEGQGYLPDRLELPALDQLFSTAIKEDGVWIYPGLEKESPVLMAWWYGGVLRNLSLLSVAETMEGARVLTEQIEQIAWSCELEGWLTSAPKLHLVAAPERAAVWEPLLNQFADTPVQVFPAASPNELAARTARRAIHSKAAVNLLPEEHVTRYKQQFIDRLWMRGLFAVFAVYMVGVILYLGGLQIVKFQNHRVQGQLASISQSFTNALELDARIQVIEDRQNLKYAALDCWKAVAETMPEGLTLDHLTFSRGKTFQLNGTVSPENQGQILDFIDALRRVVVNGQPLFSQVATPTIQVRGQTADWRFECTLRTAEDR